MKHDMAKKIITAEVNKPLTQTFNFGDALAFLKAGGRVQRTGWNGKGQFIALQVPDEKSKMSLPYIFISTVDGAHVPWIASQTDLLATDWQII